MKIIDNIRLLLGDDLKESITHGAKLKIAASRFSIYAYESLKSELSKINSLELIFTAPTFVPNEVTDRLRKERREFLSGNQTLGIACTVQNLKSSYVTSLPSGP